MNGVAAWTTGDMKHWRGKSGWTLPSEIHVETLALRPSNTEDKLPAATWSSVSSREMMIKNVVLCTSGEENNLESEALRAPCTINSDLAVCVSMRLAHCSALGCYSLWMIG
ncbi:hypothetical protein CGLO_05979 [Colletotrichum gloeosporioides Cg-14]|uniref:Uncharacterized protein n=1 Tax=Colletotrichum gloeosporioides (strain Cg-14) TaxID=1237896 RepID=T0KFK5_COLGC|nr:hypothetical protein CGLO_05979 [Colletotrichum gloeosporioides Cg-14]